MLARPCHPNSGNVPSPPAGKEAGPASAVLVDGVPTLPWKDSWTGQEVVWCTRLSAFLERVESNAVIKKERQFKK